MVAGGTSANKRGKWDRPIELTEFVLQTPQSLQKCGLSDATAFQFEGIELDRDGKMTGGTILTLPYTVDFFIAVAPALTPVSGHIDLNDARTKGSFIQAGKAANLSRLIAEERLRLQRATNATSALR